MSANRLAALAGTLLFALNSWVCWALYGTEWLDQRASIEGAYIGLAQYIQAHPGEYRWFPNWYGGIPFQNTYPPLLHFLTAWTSSLSGWSVALSYHKLCAFFYALGPVTLFVFAGRLFRCWRPAWLAALAYSGAPASIWLMASIHRDMGVWLGPRRLQALAGWGEGPHVAALALVPLAWWLVLEQLRQPARWKLALAATACAAVALTNWLGCFTMVAGIVFLWAAERPAAWRTVLGVGALAYALASPWIPPSTVLTVRANAQVLGNYDMSWRNTLALVVLLAVTFALRRWGFAAMLLLFMTALPVIEEYARFALLPQAFRYHLVMEMAVALAAGYWLARMPWRPMVLAVATLAAVAACYVHRDYSRLLIVPMKAPESWEYQAARWVTEQRPGERVFATGSVRLWWLAFSPNPQLDGGFFQGLTNPQISAAGWMVPRAEPRLAWLWLRAMGIGVVVAGTEKTYDQYHEWSNTARLRQVLQPLWDSDHDVIFAVPGARRGLAAVVEAEALPGAPLDLERYVAALDNPVQPDARFEWGSAHTARVTTAVAPGSVLSVHISYHPGWRATVAGQAVPIVRDALGQMAIAVPPCSPACTVDLVFDGGMEARLARWAQRLALLLLVGLTVSSWREHAPRLREQTPVL